jgi:hypothetical protein
MLFFPNTMFYTLLLLVFSVSLLYLAACSSYVTILIYVIVVIVYGGAIMILIGYICAVCPNVSFSRSSLSSMVFLFLVPVYLLSELTYTSPTSLVDLSVFFYSHFGFFIFIVLFTSLFVTLLIVTSQHSSPKGPFRSVSL